MKKTLNAIINRHYLTSSLTPVFTVELLLLALYFGISGFMTTTTMDMLLDETKQNIHEISHREAQNINQQLKEISTFAKIFQSEHQRFFENPDNFGLPYGMPEFAIADNGVFYKKNDNGGSSLYYSSTTPISDKESQKALKTEAFDPLFKEMVIQNPNIVQVYLSAYDNMIRIYPFIEDVVKQFGPTFNIGNFNFYYEADTKHNPKRNVVWTDAYLDLAGHGWMMSCIVPIYNQDFLEGVTGIDVTIEKLVDNILTLDLPWQASAFLVNQEGMILAMPEKVENYFNLKELKSHAYGNNEFTETIEKPEEFNLLKNQDEKLVMQLKKLFASNDIMIDFTIQNHDFLLQQEIIEETGWRLLFLVDKEIIFQPVFELKTLARKIGFLMIVLMILFYIGFLFYLIHKSHLLATRISTPIANLAQLSSEMVSNLETIDVKKMESDIAEVNQLSNNFNTMVLHLQKLFANLEEARNTLEIKVEERTHELFEILDHLKRTQQKLVQSEKMAALGQLVAGIAHEVNTPLGAIRSSVDNIGKFLDKTLEQLPAFFKTLSDQQQSDFFALLQRSLSQSNNLFSVKEERKFKRALTRQLEENDIKNAATVATKLVNMGIYDRLESVLPLLKSDNSADILQIAYKLSGLQKSTQNITIATERASKVVFALKNFARYDEKGEKVQANLIEGIETILTLYHNQLKPGIEVIRNYGELPLIECYPDELNQVWTNLIHNALQAMNYKGTLQIDVMRQDLSVLIRITDSGPGIPDEIKPKIFEPFFTTKPPGEGSGLGLDIVNKIVEKHDAKITVESQPGQTTFMISIDI
ncbi:sensor signal transduction histidine kinase [Beggiatoa sp. PS]|nr:sensor signal transduction histidine kinase [Beggiatoa sp. PS]